MEINRPTNRESHNKSNRKQANYWEGRHFASFKINHKVSNGHRRHPKTDGFGPESQITTVVCSSVLSVQIQLIKWTWRKNGSRQMMKIIRDESIKTDNEGHKQKKGPRASPASPHFPLRPFLLTSSAAPWLKCSADWLFKATLLLLWRWEMSKKCTDTRHEAGGKKNQRKLIFNINTNIKLTWWYSNSTSIKSQCKTVTFKTGFKTLYRPWSTNIKFLQSPGPISSTL